MSLNSLGIFDTPADRQEVRVAAIIVGLLFASLLIVFPLRLEPAGEINAFVAVIDTTMIAAELTIAALLYAQATVFRSLALTILASGYLFVALLLAGHALTFPGGFSPDGLLGAGVNTAAWLAAIRRVAFPAAVILYACAKRADQPEVLGDSRRGLTGLAMFVAAAAAGLIIWFAIADHASLPSLFVSRQEGNARALLILNSVTFVATAIAMAMLSRPRLTVLDLWLLVAMAAWLAQTVLNLTLTARFTIGWYSLFFIMQASSLVVMIALMAESARLYARLAVESASRKREQANRLMSMDALAAAVSHEVGQPLSAVVTNAMAAQNWLNRPQPDHQMAIKAIDGTIEAGRRTFDVIKSVRAMFAPGSSTFTEFNMNELVGETISFMKSDLIGAKIELRLELAKELETVRADRIQIQRVLINLLTNAMEALHGQRRGRRRLTLRTAAFGHHDVALDLVDTGAGIDPDSLERIFEPFFTTKVSGRGLGLSLCRAIVEDHGGHLWASPGEPVGAVIHLTLPSKRAA